LAIDCDFWIAGNDKPMLGPFRMTLITKAPTWFNADSFDLVVGKLAENFIASPRAL
jgi:hypothetical protein